MVDGEKAVRWQSLARLGLAIAVVQLFFWLIFNPVFVQPKIAPFSPYEITKFQYAEIQSPDMDGLEQSAFEAIPAGKQMHFGIGYHASRSEIFIPAIPADGAALLDTSGGDNTRFYVNGQLLTSYGDALLPEITYHGLLKEIIHIPPSMLRVGRNRIDNIMIVDIPRNGGFPTPILGDHKEISKAFAWKAFLLNDGKTISVAIGFALSLFILVALFRSEQKGLLLWLFLLTFSWSLRSHFYLWFDMPIHGFNRVFYYAEITLFLSVCWPIFIDQWTGRPLKYFRELMLAAFAIGALAIAYWLAIQQSQNSFSHTEYLLDRLGLAFMACTLARLAWHFFRSRDDRYWEAALLIMLGVLLALFLINTMLWGKNTPYLTLTQPLFLFAFVIAFFARNFRLFQSSAQINSLLKTQLDERTTELEQAHAREKNFVRMEAHVHERKRITRDMHDGLGSHLMSMLMMAKRRRGKHEEYADGLQQVIDEMRLMIDSIDSVGESLTSALSIFRKRVMPKVENAGFAFEWQMAHDCPLPEYGPRDVLQIFRILQEAVTNAIKHSGGDRIDISITPDDDPDTALKISVADNGSGILASNERGRGLGNMQSRAEDIGAIIDISGGKEGTSVTLLLSGKPTHDEMTGPE